jgi:GTPase SAR1 family protein
MAHIDEFNQRKDQLLSLIVESKAIFVSLGMLDEVQKAETLFQRLRKHSFKVLIMGQFKVGKSTFINALLGQEVLPAYAIPTTAIINEVKYGIEKKAYVYFKNPVPMPLPQYLAPSIRDYINRGNGKELNPINIKVDELEKFVVINDPAKDQAQSIAETPFEKVELFWDLPLCRNGVEIIDSPGLNEHISRTTVTMNYLSNVDAIIFVLNCTAFGAMTEMEVIDNDLIRFGHEYIFFVNNRINHIQQNQRDKIIDYGNKKLSPKTKFGEKGVFYIDALSALEGRLTNNSTMVERSGILHVEEKLEYFLANTRGKIKLEQPARNTLNAISHALSDVIPSEEKILSISIQEIEKRLLAEKPRLERLRKEKDQITQRISNRIDRICIDASREVDRRFSEIVNNTPQWINELQLESSFRAFHPKDSATQIIDEILNKYQVKLEKEQIDWTTSSLNPFVQEKMEDLQEEFRTKLESFYLEVDAVKMKLSGVDVNVKDPSKGERIGAAIVGLFVDAGSALYGAQFGFSAGLFKQMALQIGAIITMLLVGITNPLTMLPVILVIALGSIWIRGNQVEQKIKQEVSNKICAHIQTESVGQSEKILLKLKQDLHKLTKSIGDSLTNELNSVEEQVNNVLEEKRKGEAKVAQRKQVLETFKMQISIMKTKITNLLQSLDR